MSRDHLVTHEVVGHAEAEPAARLVDFLGANGRNLAIGAAVIAAVVIGIVLYRKSNDSGEKAASAQLAKAYDNLAQGQNDPAASTLNEVVSHYGGTRSGNQARLLLGNIELGKGNAVAAQTQYEGFLNHARTSDYLWSGGQRGKATALENQGKFAEASEAYEKLLQAPLGDEEKAHALLDAARASSEANNSARTLALTDRIIKEFSTTRAVPNAKLLKGEAGGSK